MTIPPTSDQGSAEAPGFRPDARADPIAALLIAAFLVREGTETWRGEEEP